MIKAVLNDIEGTTSSLTFVKDVLFPYARLRMADFVGTHGDEEEVRRLLNEVSIEAGRNLSDTQAVDQLVQWIDQDRKITPLKVLQGLIWEEGFRRGEFVGHVYEDAALKLREWHESGIRLYIYSSGSVHAQKLLFSHTDQGDLTPLFSGYFDTRVGAKQDVESYRRIAGEIGLVPGSILFLSDIGSELDAAQEAGMATVWLVREGPLDPDAAHRQIRNYASLMLRNPSVNGG